MRSVAVIRSGWFSADFGDVVRKPRPLLGVGDVDGGDAGLVFGPEFAIERIPIPCSKLVFKRSWCQWGKGTTEYGVRAHMT